MARAAGVLLSLCALWLGVATASGAPVQASVSKSVGAPGAFEVKGSNGYSIYVFGVEMDEGTSDSVAIFVLGRTGGVSYVAPGTVSGDSIQADLGDLGEIAVRYHPSGQERTVRSGCVGDPVTFDAGTYEGTIAFHGELGYTDVEVTAASGDVGSLLGFFCGDRSGGVSGPFLPGAELEVATKAGPHLEVVKNRPTARAHFGVGVYEKYAGIEITRFVGKLMPPSSFRYDPKIRTATLRPPAPFSGTAQFHRNAKPANRWTGDLTVDLPGREDVALTGTGFWASLVHARWDRHLPAR